MYIALRGMSVRMPDCSVLALLAGETVPHFAEWHPLTQKAMIDQCWVRWAADGKLSPHEETMAAKQVSQPVPHGPLGTPADRLPKAPPPPALFAPALPEVRQMVVDGQQAQDTVVVEPTVVVAKTSDDILAPARAPMLNDGVVTTSAPPTGKGAHDCPYCARAGFKDYNGLRVHMARAHKDA